MVMQFDLQPVNSPMTQTAQPGAGGTQPSPANKFDLQEVSTPVAVQEQQKEQDGMLDKMANNPITTGINSLGGGIGEAAINTINQAQGIGPLDHSKLNPVIQQASAEQPTTNAIGKGIGTVAPYVAGTMGATAVTGTVLKAGLLNDVAANGIVGMLGAGPGNRTLGGIIGAVSAPVSTAISSTAKFLTGALGINTVFKNTINKIGTMVTGVPEEVAAKSQANVWTMANATENKLFQSFRNADGGVEANPIVTQAASFLHNNADELLPAQQKSITNLITNTANAKSLADLHDARKIFAYDYSKFTEGRPLTGDANQEFRALNNTISSVMANNAEKLGVGEQFAVANRFYQDTTLPLINTGAKDTAEALADSTDPLTSAKITDTLLSKYVNPAKPEVAKAFLATLDDTGRRAVEVKSVQNLVKSATNDVGGVDYLKFNQALKGYMDSTAPIFSQGTKDIMSGLSKSIEEATHLGSLELDFSRVGTTSKLYGLAGAAGAAGALYNADKSGPGQHANIGQDVAAGLGTAAVLVMFHGMLSSPVGQSLLLKAGSEGGRSTAKSILSGMVIQSALRYGDTSNNNGGQQ